MKAIGFLVANLVFMCFPLSLQGRPCPDGPLEIESVQGRVFYKSHDGKAPAMDMSVEVTAFDDVNHLFARAKTNQKGEFHIKGLRPGYYALHVGRSAPGGFDVQIEIVRSGKNKNTAKKQIEWILDIKRGVPCYGGSVKLVNLSVRDRKIRVDASRKGEPTFPKDTDSQLMQSLDVDSDPCGEIKSSNTTRKLEENVVVFLTYSGNNISTARVRLTCEFQEPIFPRKTLDPLMSKVTFERLVKKLDEIRSIGSYIKSDGPDVSVGAVTLHRDVYTNAVVEWFEFRCHSQDQALDCGVRRFNVYYTK